MPPQPVQMSPPVPGGAVTRTLQTPPEQNQSSEETISPLVTAKLMPPQSASVEQPRVQMVPWLEGRLQSVQVSPSQDSPPTASRQTPVGQSPGKPVSQKAPS